jgi:carbonic anhydrase
MPGKTLFVTDLTAPPRDQAAPADVLRDLLAGNERWVAGQARHPRQSPDWRERLAIGQEPLATVLTCIDSRVPPELLFDCGLGEMFVIRTGAQMIDDGIVLASAQFGPVSCAVTRLILVLGHSGCGAVAAAIPVLGGGGRAPGRVQALVDALRPAYAEALRESGDLAANMIRAQTRLTVGRLERDPVLRELADDGGLLIAGGHYDLASGAVTLLS